MAKGIAVLAAALAGKRVRLRGRSGGPPTGWIHWNGRQLVWSAEDVPCGGRINDLFSEEWEIDEPSLTFVEAVTAMEHGGPWPWIERMDNKGYRVQIKRLGTYYWRRVLRSDGTPTEWVQRGFTEFGRKAPAFRRGDISP